MRFHESTDPRYGASFSQVDATVKKHEAISADILARVERFNDLTAMALELEKENYHGKERVKKRESEVLEKWRKLLELLENHKKNLNQMSNIMSLLREIDATLISVYDLKVQMYKFYYCHANIISKNKNNIFRHNSHPKMSVHICWALKNFYKRMPCKSYK